MAGWSGSGVFTRNYNWTADAAASIKILASKFDTEHDTFTTGINACLAKNGENTATGNLKLGTFRLTGVGDATALQDAATANQIVDNALTYGGASAAGTDTYAVNLAINPGAYTAGMRVQFIADVANTGACTLNVHSNGAKSIKLQDGTDPPDNYIIIGAVVDVEYDGTNMVLMNVPGYAEFASGTFTTASLASMAWDSRDITHGLVADNIDIGFSAFGGGASLLQVSVAGIMRGTDGRLVSLNSGEVTSGITANIPDFTLPSTGDFRIHTLNAHGASSQTVTVKWWARKR